MEITTSKIQVELIKNSLQFHLFIPELFNPLELWRQDFGFMPRSQSLARLAQRRQRKHLPVQGIERTLLYLLGVNSQVSLPWAQWRYAVHASAMPTKRLPLLCADPVSLNAELDRVTLAAQKLQLNADEAARLIEDLNAFLKQDGWALVAGSAEHWYLYSLDESLPKRLPKCTPLSEMGKSNIFNHLPQSTDRYWQRLVQELQMLLHNHTVNQRRAAAGHLQVNSLWFWGEDSDSLELSAPSQSAFDKTGDLKLPNSVMGGGITGQVCAQHAQAQWYEAIDVTQARDVCWVIADDLREAALLDQPQAWQAALTRMEEKWLGEVLAAWEQGASVYLYDMAGNAWTCLPRAWWQFWKRDVGEWLGYIRQ